MCSDKTVGLRGDSINIDKSDVGFKVDTDPELVREFLERETDDIKAGAQRKYIDCMKAAGYEQKYR